MSESLGQESPCVYAGEDVNKFTVSEIPLPASFDLDGLIYLHPRVLEITNRPHGCTELIATYSLN
jgi:hypothetical protein